MVLNYIMTGLRVGFATAVRGIRQRVNAARIGAAEASALAAQSHALGG